MSFHVFDGFNSVLSLLDPPGFKSKFMGYCPWDLGIFEALSFALSYTHISVKWYTNSLQGRIIKCKSIISQPNAIRHKPEEL